MFLTQVSSHCSWSVEQCGDEGLGIRQAGFRTLALLDYKLLIVSFPTFHI